MFTFKQTRVCRLEYYLERCLLCLRCTFTYFNLLCAVTLHFFVTWYKGVMAETLPVRGQIVSYSYLADHSPFLAFLFLYSGFYLLQHVCLNAFISPKTHVVSEQVCMLCITEPFWPLSPSCFFTPGVIPVCLLKMPTYQTNICWMTSARQQISSM